MRRVNKPLCGLFGRHYYNAKTPKKQNFPQGKSLREKHFYSDYTMRRAIKPRL